MIRWLVALAALLAAAPVAAQAPGKTLRLIPHADLRSLDPIWTTAYITRNHGYMVYDTLLGTDSGFVPRPQMADGWTQSEDGRTYRFVLRKGLKFHDGAPVTPADCIASVQRWAKRDVLGQKIAEATESWSVDDERSFTLRLKRPFPLVLPALAKLSSSPAFIMPKRLAETDANSQVADATGSGPFRFVKEEWNPGHRAVYARFEGYVPRGEPADWTAGGKVAKVDRVEWIYIPDAATASAALASGEVDWWEQVAPDLLPVIERNRELVVAVADRLGAMGYFRFNHLHPPFDNVLARRAVLAALDQREFMSAAVGDERYWRTCPSYFACGVPMENDAGSAALAGPRDLAAARRLLAESGYKGERVVLLDPSDVPQTHAQALVAADLLKRIGFNVDLQTMDWGTVVQRRAMKEPIERNGWSVFLSFSIAPIVGDPVGNIALDAGGDKAWLGWPNDPRIETLRRAWLDAPDLAAQKRVARDLQEAAFESVPYVPTGQFQIPTAYRKTVSGIIPAPVTLLWNVEKK